MVAADDRRAVAFSLTPRHRHGGPAGRELLLELPTPETAIPLIMDREYEGEATLQLAMDLGFDPAAPLPKHRRVQWS